MTLKYYRLQKIREISIQLDANDSSAVDGPVAVGTHAARENKIELSQLIHILNERFGTEFTPNDQLFLDSVREDAVADPEIRESALANTRENFDLFFSQKLEDFFVDRMDRNEKIAERFMNDRDFQSAVAAEFLKDVYGKIREQEDDACKTSPFKRVRPEPHEQNTTCIPLFSLKAAAGAFGQMQSVEPEGWVLPATSRKLRSGMFVAQVVGRSMEPRIPDGAWCLFAAPVTGARSGRVLLVQHREIDDPETGGNYTVKRYQSEKTLRDGEISIIAEVLEVLHQG